jgi:excisionase family DNA binding protein
MAKGGRRIRIFSALEVANICGVVNQTAINWIRSGHLKAFTTPGGQYRIYAKDLAAFLDKRGMSTSGEALQVLMENANWNTFLVAAKSINSSLKSEITNLFPGFTIITANNWFEIGRKFAEEKPGFVLLDTELSGVDISGFIYNVKNDLSFGRPYILLLAEHESQHYEGADFVLAKPLDLGKLDSAVRSLEKQLEQEKIA